MDQKIPLDTPKRPLPPKGPQSSRILRSLRDKFRHERSRSHIQPFPSSDTVDAASSITENRYSSSTLSPVESPVPSPHPSATRQEVASESSGYAPASPYRLPPSPRAGFVDLAATKEPRTEAPPNDTDDVPSLRQIPITFAIDVSGSTKGRILRQEQDAVRAVRATFDRPALLSQSIILPWSHKAGLPVELANLENLTSGGGTNPAILLETPDCKSRLQDSNLWFLLTDGFIEEPLVRRFANAIPTAGVHGTACVIVLFGYTGTSPFDCNVSVGMSVFAVAPHCIFLFHDVRTGVVYVFQAKGCFAKLLPDAKRFASFGRWTRWADLVQITYAELGEVKVPLAMKLPQDTVVLPDGRQFDMNDIYNDTLSEADKVDLLSDYQALDVIILAAKTRGKDDAVKAWISNARSARESKDPISLQREDVGGKGGAILKALLKESAGADAEQPEMMWQALRAAPSSPELEALQAKLRQQHLENWHHFGLTIEAECDLSTRMDEAFKDVLTTMRAYENTGVQTPALLTPMTSPDPMHSQTCTSPRTSPLAGLARPGIGHGAQPQASKRRSGRSPAQGFLFLPGFKGSRTLPSRRAPPANYGTCSICGGENVIQTLLLQRNSESEDTPHFPRANSQSKHKYPLVLGNYPETDVIVPLTACDACAFLMLQEPWLPNGERIDAALPLVSLMDGENRRQWLETLNRLFDYRFHERITLLVFLSSICSTIEDLTGNDEPNFHSLVWCLEWCCREICELPGVSTVAGLTPVGSPVSAVVHDTMPLKKALELAFLRDALPTMELPFLAYPIEGFVALVQLASLLMGIEPHAIELFVWKRLLYHLTERHVELQKQLGAAEANLKLIPIVFKVSSETNLQPSSASPPVPVLSLSVSALTETYLMPADVDAIYQFQRMGHFFAPIETTAKYHAALAVFLYMLLSESLAEETGCLDVDEVFTRVRYRADKARRSGECLYDVFEDPKLVVEADAVKLVESCGL